MNPATLLKIFIFVDIQIAGTCACAFEKLFFAVKSQLFEVNTGSN